MGTPTTISSPWVWNAQDYQGNSIQITITFNNSTRAITGGTCVRDAACVYGHIYLDTPTLNKSFTVPVGTTNVTANQIKTATGFTTIEQVLAVQITAGP